MLRPGSDDDELTVSSGAPAVYEGTSGLPDRPHFPTPLSYRQDSVRQIPSCFGSRSDFQHRQCRNRNGVRAVGYEPDGMTHALMGEFCLEASRSAQVVIPVFEDVTDLLDVRDFSVEIDAAPP